MVCDVVININEGNNHISIPYRSILVDDEGKSFVFLVDTLSKKVKKQYINIGKYSGTDVELFSGLNIGDFIVLEGKEKIKENQLIEY